MATSDFPVGWVRLADHHPRGSFAAPHHRILIPPHRVSFIGTVGPHAYGQYPLIQIDDRKRDQHSFECSEPLKLVAGA